MPGAPTYRTETNDQGQTVYHCLYCEDQGQEHHATDEALFIQHMEQRHDGRMQEDTAASARAQDEHPHGGPPGQTGEHPEHPHGGPPGQDKPPEPEDLPHPEHPIVLPDEEPPQPEEGA